MTIAMYGLLHLAEGESSAENVAIKDFDQRVSLYGRCATTLANSLRTVGVEFTLLTNQSAVEHLSSCIMGETHDHSW